MNSTSEKMINFINKANLIHKNKYSYENVIYVNAKSKVIVSCPIHKNFEITPDNHLRKRGCAKCSGKNMSKNDFVLQSQKVHKFYYDYSESFFVNKSKHVKILCPVHGGFMQLPSVHLNGSGCPKCVGRGKSFDEIIQEANKVHNSKYQYLDFSIKKDSKNKTRSILTIYCAQHNYTWDATTDNHIKKGTGCIKCGDESSRLKQQSDFVEIIKKINLIHPEYSIDSDQKYVNQHTNIKYKCSYHGIQRGRPLNLLTGQGCPVCGQESRNDFFRDDWSFVIEKIHLKHENYYVYPEQPFINHHTPIVFNCPLHGDKISNANNLLCKGSGCNECGNTKSSESQKSDWKLVFEQIENINPNIKILANQKYINTNTKIQYSCNKHGIHLATPSKLLKGQGCPDCAVENRYGYSDSAWVTLCRDRIAKLYWIEMEFEGKVWYKFGRTFMSIKDRFWELKRINVTYKIIKVVTRDPLYICHLERRIHKLYKKHRYVPPIDFGGVTECFVKY